MYIYSPSRKYLLNHSPSDRPGAILVVSILFFLYTEYTPMDELFVSCPNLPKPVIRR